MALPKAASHGAAAHARLAWKGFPAGLARWVAPIEATGSRQLHRALPTKRLSRHQQVAAAAAPQLISRSQCCTPWARLKKVRSAARFQPVPPFSLAAPLAATSPDYSCWDQNAIRGRIRAIGSLSPLHCSTSSSFPSLRLHPTSQSPTLRLSPVSSLRLCRSFSQHPLSSPPYAAPAKTPKPLPKQPPGALSGNAAAAASPLDDTPDDQDAESASSSPSSQPNSQQQQQQLQRTESGRWVFPFLPPVMGRGRGQGKGQQVEKRGSLLWRVQAWVRESILYWYTSFFYNAVLRLATKLGAEAALRRIQPQAEQALAAATGSFHEMADGTRLPFSLVNNIDPDFSIPPYYRPLCFPFNSGRPTLNDPPPPPAAGPEQPKRSEAKVAGPNKQADARPGTWDPEKGVGNPVLPEPVPEEVLLARLHFLALCMKLVYEREDVIRDIVERCWGLKDHGGMQTPKSTKEVDEMSSTERRFVPRTAALVISSPYAIIIAFRGTEPTNLINWFTNASVSMVETRDLGRLHEGFFDAITYETAEKDSLWSRLVALMRDGIDPSGKRQIYITGHSLGGALASVFAQVLQANEPDLAQRVGGVITFGAPRIGDGAFCERQVEAYDGRVYRVVHAADIITKLPPAFMEYVHCGTEVFINSFGTIITDPDQIQREHAKETWGFVPLYMYKIGAGLTGGESPLRLFYRFLFMLGAGFNDHIPADYERKLRQNLKPCEPCVSCKP